MYQTLAEAFVGELQHLLVSGAKQTVRASTTLEVLNRTITVAEPLDRSIVVPHRRNDPFATVAETMWVLAGRDDIAYLTHYLPRAPEFSDDGVTWRGAYGPRLRAWGSHRVDQFAEVVNLLRHDPLSRRAVMSLFDPGADFAKTKDVPCNNWLHFIVRDGQLHLNIAVRSNDIMWGFSGINSYQWSVLHEMVAQWVGVATGSMTFFVSSLHIYERHFARGQRIATSATATDTSPAGPGPRFATPFEEFDRELERWFGVESVIRSGQYDTADVHTVNDPLLREYLLMLRIRAMHLAGEPRERIRVEIRALEGEGHRQAVNEYLYHSASAETDPTTAPRNVDEQQLRHYVRDLHRAKDATYGTSWKRRGEAMGIMANLARKADRLDALTRRAPEDDETLLDTVVDLLVYGLKYQTYLADLDAELALRLLPKASRPFSEGTIAVEHLLANLKDVGSSQPPALLITPVLTAFKALEQTFMGGQSTPSQRSSLLDALTREAFTLAAAIVGHTADHPNGVTPPAWPSTATT